MTKLNEYNLVLSGFYYIIKFRYLFSPEVVFFFFNDLNGGVGGEILFSNNNAVISECNHR